MLAISIIQPWPFGIVFLDKRLENRSWPVPRHVIGQRVAIHVSKTWNPDEVAVDWDDCHEACADDGLWRAVELRFGKLRLRDLDAMRGRVIGSVLVMGDVTQSDSPWFCGEHGHVYDRVLALPSMVGPVRGALGYWQLPDDIADQVLHQEALARGVA